MKKWYAEEYEWEIKVIGFLHGSQTEGYCRNGEEIGDTYTCGYGCPVNAQGLGICSKAMLLMFPVMEAVRSGGNLENIGGSSGYRMSGRLCDFQDDGKETKGWEFFQGPPLLAGFWQYK